MDFSGLERIPYGPVNLQNFHLGELRTDCQAGVVYETRWVETGTGATPHTVIFSLAPRKRQIQPGLKVDRSDFGHVRGQGQFTLPMHC